MATNQGFKNLIPGADVDPSYLFYLGRSLGREMTRRASGTTFLEISGREFKRIEVRMPPLEEQQRIAEILDTIDATIQSTERVIAKHEHLRSGLVTALLAARSGQVDARSSLVVEEERSERAQFAAQCSTPWPVSRLGQLVEVLDSRRVPVREEDRPSGPVPYYGANGQQGWIDRALFDEPLILLAEDGGHFDAFADRPIAYRIDGPSWVNNHAHVIRAAAGVDQSFLFWSLRNKDIRRWIAGGTRTKLTQGEMMQVLLRVPPLEQQVAIAERLDALEETIDASETELQKLLTLRTGLSTDLLSGRVRTLAMTSTPE